MVYIHCDKKRQPLVLRGFWSTAQHQNQLKDQDLHHYSSFNFCHHEVIGWLEWHTDSPAHLLTLYLCHRLALLHALCQVACPSPPSFCVSARSDLNRNNIVNWGYCKWRSQPDRQPLFPALTAPHHTRKDTWFLNPHPSLPHLHRLLLSEQRPGIKVQFPPFFPTISSVEKKKSCIVAGQ